MEHFKVKNVLFTEVVDKACHDILLQHRIQVDVNTGLTPEELAEVIKEYEAIVVRSETKVNKMIIENGKKLKIIGRAGAGVDNIDVVEATKHGILVLNSPGGNSISACELTCGLIMDLARNIAQGCMSMKNGQWLRSKLKGEELCGRNLGVIGLGRIGREVARRMKAFDMNILGFDPFLPAEEVERLGIVPSTLDQIWAEADYITVHTPLNAMTRNLINRETLAKCKTGVKIINVARGGIIDEEAIFDGLNSGKVGGVAFDVFTQEPPKEAHLVSLITHPKVITTPHLGASTNEAQKRVAIEIAEQIVALSQLNESFSVQGCVNSSSIREIQKYPQWSTWAYDLGRRLGESNLREKQTLNGVVLNIEFASPKRNFSWIEHATLLGFLSVLPNTRLNLVNVLEKAALHDISTHYTETYSESFKLTVSSDSPSGSTITLLGYPSDFINDPGQKSHQITDLVNQKSSLSSKKITLS